MEYQVTAARRRPQRFEDLLGQDFVAATLQKSLESGKIAHAYLFSGPRGCGKTSSARILAKALNCGTGMVSTPCGVCTSCREIASGASFDVIEIDGASNTGVNDVRQIKDEILFPPHASRYKIYIIDEVHMLSTSAFNALLKTIEEPPQYVIFIFATTELHKVPATIKSRCQHFNFKLVSVELLKKALSDAVAELQIQADDEALYWIAREATGSVRDCYTLFDQVAAFSDGHITFEKIQKTLGLTGTDSIAALLTACVHKDAASALLLLDTILQNGVSVEQFLVDCTAYFRTLLLIQHGIENEALIGRRKERFPKEVLDRWSAQHIERGLSLLLQLFRDIRFSLNPRYELELAVSRLAWLSDYVSPNELKTVFDAAQHLVTKGGTSGAVQIRRDERRQAPTSTSGYNPWIKPSPAGAAAPRMGTVPRTAGISAGSTEPLATEQSHPETNGGCNPDSTVLPVSQAAVAVSGIQVSVSNPRQEPVDDRVSQASTLEALRDVLIPHLKVEHSMLAIALEKNDRWYEENGEIHISVQNLFELQLLQKERPLLTEKIRQFYHKACAVSIIQAEPAAEPKKNIQVPEQIEMIRKHLKGTIVDIQRLSEIKDIDMEEDNDTESL